MGKTRAMDSRKKTSKKLGVRGGWSKIKKSVAGRSNSANNGKAENNSPSQTAPRTPQKVVQAPSSSSEVSKQKYLDKIISICKDVDLEELTEEITRLLEQIEKKKAQKLKQPSPGKPKRITDSKNIIYLLSNGVEDLLSTGAKIVTSLEDIIAGPVKEILKGIGHAHFATAGLLVIVYCLERYEDFSDNKEECLKLLKEMCYVAGLVKVFKETRKGLVNVIEDATALIVEGAILCCTQMSTHTWIRILKSRKDKADLKEVTEKLDRMYLKINVQMGFRKSPLWKRRPKHADGIENSTKEVMKLLECDSEQNVVIVILHGLKGRGKTTLAEAVFSEVKVEGYKYSKVRLFKDINSTRDIIEFQKAILQDLMEPEETVPDIRTHEDGQDALEEKLEKVEAFIYIDNVLKSSELQLLLPKSVDGAKRVRFLLTARDVEDFTYACPRLPLPRAYHVKGIEQRDDAISILKNEIDESQFDESQIDEIIKICGGVPPMLTLVAAFIGRANDEQNAYNKLKQEKDKCGIPDNCRDPDPFLDIIRSFFKKQDTSSLTVDEEDVKTPEMNTTGQERILISSSTLGKRKCIF